MLAASSLSAQSTHPPARPEFKTLRFDEDWTTDNRSTQWDEAIKAIPLVSSPNVSLTMAGQARWRAEFVRGFNLSAADDDHAQSRLQLSADLRAGQPHALHARLFAEARDAQSYGRTLPGGARPSDADRHDVQNLFADIGVGKSWVRYGRQEIVFNRERQFGVPDWSNTRRGAEGTRMQLTHGALTLEATDARPVVVRQNTPNRADESTRFRTISVGSASGAAPLMKGLPGVWQGYWYEQTIRTPATLSLTRRLSSGGRALWQWNAPAGVRRYSLEVEGAAQRGHTGAQTIRGWFWVAEGVTRWQQRHGAPSLAFGIEEASGDRTQTPSVNEAFTTLYPAAHAHGGYADVIGRANARELHLIATWTPVKTIDLRGAWYRFDRRAPDAGIYTKTNTVFRAANGSTARHAADEVDVTGTWNVSRHSRVIAGGAVVMPGPFLKTTPGGAETEHWAFVGTTFTF